MRIAQIGFYRDPADRLPDELLEAWPTLVDVAESIATAGTDVSVIQASGHSRHFAETRSTITFCRSCVAAGSVRRRRLWRS